MVGCPRWSRLGARTTARALGCPAGASRLGDCGGLGGLRSQLGPALDGTGVLLGSLWGRHQYPCCTAECGQPVAQNDTYLVLSAAERAKGFVRPVRYSYVHVGTSGPVYQLRDLTEVEKGQFSPFNYVKYETYPEGKSSVVGRFWTQEQLDSIGKGCGTLTTMGQALAETYARDPGFYGATYCCGCSMHRRVGADGEFVWEGTDERVGT